MALASGARSTIATTVSATTAWNIKIEKRKRRKPVPQFSPEVTRTLRAALDDAAVKIQSDSSTTALMAEQILKAAADGVYRREELTAIALKAARKVND